jgi:uncharacterized protein YciI
MWYLTFSKPAATREQIMPHLQEHLDWQRTMHDAGTMLFSGPSADHSMGIMVLRAGSLDEAKQTLDSEPFHKLGLRTYEVIEWDVHQGMGIGGFTSESLALLGQEKTTAAST